jgi:hypothetical protein
MFPTGLRRIKLETQTSKPIAGEKIWYASGKVTDGSVVVLYQKSLCLIIGEEGIMLTNSFLLPKFLVSYFLLPWTQVSDQSVCADRYQFHFDGIEICLFGKHVTQAVRCHSPCFNASLSTSSNHQ